MGVYNRLWIKLGDYPRVLSTARHYSGSLAMFERVFVPS